ncbi:MAG: type II secretion system F family protein [Oligoflexia bacterium]|nr:type II secretion system F family protein [Oligoflexia bacterium]
MKIPELLLIVQELRLSLHMGRSLRSVVREMSQSSSFSMGQSLGAALGLWEKSHTVEHNLWNQTPKRRALVQILQMAMRGSPAEAILSEFEEELFHCLETELVKQTQLMPVKMVLPLTLCILPAFLLSLIGPFIMGSLL